MTAFFSSPRVVIVDDNPTEAAPIIKGFSKYGCPIAWFTGDGMEGVPAQPLPFVRILILDLELVSPFDAKHTAGVIYRVLAPTSQSGPCLLIIWTGQTARDNEFHEAFKHYNSLMEKKDQVIPIKTITLQKSIYLKSDNTFSVEELMKQINSEIESIGSMQLLMEWECACAEAAALTTGRISSLPEFLTETNPREQTQDLDSVLTILAQVAAPKSETRDWKSTEFKAAIYESLAMIHEDSVRHFKIIEPEASPINPFHSTFQRSEMIAALNTIFLISPESNPKAPGSVLELRGLTDNVLPFNLRTDNKGAQYKSFISKIFANITDEHAEIDEKCIPIMMEISPACDYHIDKRSNLRFLPGLLVPNELRARIRDQADYLRKIGPILYKGEIKWIILCSLHFFALAKKSSLQAPIFRLRSHVRIDTQVWLGSHLARPGHLSLSFPVEQQPAEGQPSTTTILQTNVAPMDT